MNYQSIFHIFTAVLMAVALVAHMSALVKGRPLARNLFKAVVALIAEGYVGGFMATANLISTTDVALGCGIILVSCIMFNLITYEAKHHRKWAKAIAWHRSSSAQF